MDWLDFSMDSTRSSIKMGRKALKTNYALLVLNMALFMFNIWELYQGVQFSWITGFAAGSTGIGALWVWLLIWEIKSDLVLDKEYLSRLNELRESRNLDGMIAQYESSKNYFDEAVAKINSGEKVDLNIANNQ